MATLCYSLIFLVVVALIVAPPRRFLIPAVGTFFLVLPIAEFAPLWVIFSASVFAYLARDAADSLTTGAAALMILSYVLLLRRYFVKVSPEAPYPEWWRQLWPFPGAATGVTIRRGVVFDQANDLRLDVYSIAGVSAAPAVVFIHGGGWVFGHRSMQGQPLLISLARRGVVGISIDYRLSPSATFPDHIIDCKRALAWVRAHATELGIDPERIFVAGGSAGGHLAALLALTPRYLAWQPGFEDARTDVCGALCFYGIYDLVDTKSRWPHPGLDWLWRRFVQKQAFAQAQEAWRLASPINHIAPQAPPFFVAHGTHDSLVPIEEARVFCRSLSVVTRVRLVEVAGAQHAFDLAVSPRSRMVLDEANRFVTEVLGRA